MSVSRRLRFEILRRDNYTCRYCGQAAPDVKLAVDHVLPEALGGTDQASNLVTACQPCNAGKTSIAPDSPIVDDVAEDALRWALAIKEASAMQAARFEARDSYLEAFDACWSKWTYSDGRQVTRPTDWKATIFRAYELGLDLDVLLTLVDDVVPRSNIPDERMWVYFCGALRNLMAERAEIAAGLIAQGWV